MKRRPSWDGEQPFRQPQRLNAEGHYSSAYDMALLARACLENEALAEIAATKSATVDGRVLTNHNKLLWQYEAASAENGLYRKGGADPGFRGPAGRDDADRGDPQRPG